MTVNGKRGFSIRIFLPDGMPEGIRLVEKSNWIGRAIVCSRAQFPSVKGRPEFAKTGVYVLLGPSSHGDLPTVYVGEGDPVRPRLEQHYTKKDFWTTLVLFASKDDNLNKAHVQFLESALVVRAQDAKRSFLDNANVPQPPSLSESDTAEMEVFLDEMLLIYPVLGITAFEKPEPTHPSATILHLKAKGLSASGYESQQGFIVLAGSQASRDAVPSIHRYLLTLRDTLLERGILTILGDHLTLSQDYAFDSPSTAAGVMLGRSANGRIEWKDAQGKTLRDLQQTLDV